MAGLLGLLVLGPASNGTRYERLISPRFDDCLPRPLFNMLSFRGAKSNMVVMTFDKAHVLTDSSGCAAGAVVSRFGGASRKGRP